MHKHGASWVGASSHLARAVPAGTGRPGHLPAFRFPAPPPLLSTNEFPSWRIPVFTGLPTRDTSELLKR